MVPHVAARKTLEFPRVRRPPTPSPRNFAADYELTPTNDTIFRGHRSRTSSSGYAGYSRKLNIVGHYRTLPQPTCRSSMILACFMRPGGHAARCRWLVRAWLARWLASKGGPKARPGSCPDPPPRKRAAGCGCLPYPDSDFRNPVLQEHSS